MSESNAQQRREQRLQLLEDHIGRHLADSAATGELRAAPSWGKPLHFGDGYDETPADLRMGYKILKDAGVVPPEVEFMQRIGALRAELAGAPPEQQPLLRQRLAEMEQQLALRLEGVARRVR